MKQYIVWFYAPKQAGNTEFYEIYAARNRDEAANLARRDKRYPGASITSVERWRV